MGSSIPPILSAIPLLILGLGLGLGALVCPKGERSQYAGLPPTEGFVRRLARVKGENNGYFKDSTQGPELSVYETYMICILPMRLYL